MRIQSVHIENFGKLHDFDLTLEDGWNVVCKENGWGKSTLAAFIKAMFYGLDYTTRRSLNENERKRYIPWQGGVFGGCLEFAAGEKRYRVERSFGAKDKEDAFVLYDLGTGLVSADYSECLGEELFQVDREAFERSSFFPQQNITVSVNDSLGSGLAHAETDAGDMKNYEKALASLEGRIKYYKKTGGRGRIDALKEEQFKVCEERKQRQEKERELAGWRGQFAQGEQEGRELAAEAESLRAQIRQAQEYGEKSAKKAQRDLLKSQAEGAEETIRRTLEAIKGFDFVPPEEKELDQCREEIYQLHTLRAQEDHTAVEIKSAKKCLEELQKRKEKLPGPGMAFYMLSGCLALPGAAALLQGWLLPGVLLCAAGMAALLLGLNKHYEIRKKTESLESDLLEEEKRLHKEECDFQAFRKKRVSLAKKVCQFLRVAEETDFQELERRWKLLRQKSQEYERLKQACASEEKEARKRRDAYLAFCSEFTEEELEGLDALTKPETGISQLQQRLGQCNARREALLKEQRDIHHRIEQLGVVAERILELEEEEERLSRELREAVREHGLLEKTAQYLKTARERFSSRYLRELQQGLEYYVNRLAPLAEAAPFIDVKLRLKVREAGALREPEAFSIGWQDLLQIAERMAIIDALYKKETPILILDDPLVNLDTEKQALALALLKEWSQKRQMLYFTCRGTVP